MTDLDRNIEEIIQKTMDDDENRVHREIAKMTKNKKPKRSKEDIYKEKTMIRSFVFKIFGEFSVGDLINEIYGKFKRDKVSIVNITLKNLVENDVLNQRIRKNKKPKTIYYLKAKYIKNNDKRNNKHEIRPKKSDGGKYFCIYKCGKFFWTYRSRQNHHIRCLNNPKRKKDPLGRKLADDKK